MRRTLALALHDWLLLGKGGGAVSPDAFLSSAEKAGVTKIAFLRHGKTAPKPKNGVDFDRQLTDEGRSQAMEAGSSFGTLLKPFYPHVLVSPAPRTMETAELFLASASIPVSSDTIRPIQPLYDGTMQPKGSQLFQKIGYAPLRDYVDSSDPDDRDVSRTLLGMYADTVVTAMAETLQQDTSSTTGTKTGENLTLWMVGHAIYLPAAALGVASLADCCQAGMETILSTNTKEAEGYIIDLDKSEASYLSRPSSKG